MIKTKLPNGLTVIYENKDSDLVSFCLGFNAGAIEENENEFGIAHAVEHMIFKSTEKRDEYTINKECDDIFGFYNAMTNYPYVIYYGTALALDFEKALELYSDIVLHPKFSISGFKEEINIILEELKEWKDDLYQFCEDEMLFNAFESRRIKELIIGNDESIKSISIDDIKNFYYKFYTPSNAVISVITSLSFENVLEIIKKYFCNWKSKENSELIKTVLYEKNKPGIFKNEKKDIFGAKIQFCYSIHDLTNDELKLLTLFNLYFGEGTSSKLFDEIRTKNGLAYDINSEIKNERGIKLFKISLGTSIDNIDTTIEMINELIKKILYSKEAFTREVIMSLKNRIVRNRLVKLEKSVELSKALTTYELMFNSSEQLYNELIGFENVESADILDVVKKVLIHPTIQIVLPKSK
jgi:predicted Zn-dependent peptidase